jgi:hypothetical protein
VVDHFHLVKLGNDTLTKVRRRVTWELRDHRGRKLDPEWADRRRLLRARERLSHSSFARMWNTIIDDDPSAHPPSPAPRVARKSARRTPFHCTGNQRAATQASSLPGQNRRRHMRPVGVVLDGGRGGLDLNVAWRLADGSRAGRLIGCQSRRCGGDRHGGSTRRQQ